MKLDKVIDIINFYGKDVPCVLRTNSAVTNMFDNRQQLIEKIVAISVIHDKDPWGITLSENLIEVDLDGPKIR